MSLTDYFANIPRKVAEKNAIAPSTQKEEDRDHLPVTCPECGGVQFKENIQGSQVNCDCGHSWNDRRLAAS